MTSKKIIVVSFGLCILFILIGWIATPYLMDYMVHHLVNISKDVNIISVSIRQQFKMHVFSTLSLGLVPLLVMIAALVILKIKKKTMSPWDYFFYFSIVLTVYLLASVFKFYALEATVVKVLNHPMSPGITNSLPLGQVQVYDWALYGSLIATVLIALLGKRRKK